MEEPKLNSVEEAVRDFKEGKFVIVVDDEDRENEGDLIIAAEKITPEKVNFMLKNARGVLCAPITLSRCKELDLPHQVMDNTSVLGTPFTVTVDKLEGCTTGVSAHDRAETIKALATQHLLLTRSADRAISILYTHKTTACYGVADIRKLPSTSVRWPVSIPPEL